MKMPEGVKFLELTQEKALELWDRLNQIPGLWDDTRVNRPQLFFQDLISPTTLWLEREDGNGILYLTHIIQGLSATGHVVYWDRRLRGREEFTLDVLRWGMMNIPLQKINLLLPDYAGSARSFAQRMGFKNEGCVRKWNYSNGKTYDMYIFGMTREEAFEKAQEEDDGTERRVIHGTDGEGVREGTQGNPSVMGGLPTGDTEVRPGEPGVRGDVPELVEHSGEGTELAEDPGDGSE